MHLSNRFSDAGRISASPLSCRLARLALKRMAFSPSWQFSRCSDGEGGVCLMPWSMLDAWVPGRVEALVASLETRVPHLAAVFLDCGDTLVDERTEVKIPERKWSPAPISFPALAACCMNWCAAATGWRWWLMARVRHSRTF
ncbi:hypothetical protein V6L77_09300 [Pannonibacter sp. Pt2-lr]